MPGNLYGNGIKAKIYLDNLVTKGKGPLKTSFTGNNTNSTEPEPGVSGISSMQPSESEGMLDDSFADPNETIDDVQHANVLENAIDNPVEEDDYNVQNASSVVISQAPENPLNNSTTAETASSGDKENGAACGLKTEKPKCRNLREMSENMQFLERTLSMLLNLATPRGIRSPFYALACKESPLISSKGLSPTMMQPGITWIPFMATLQGLMNWMSVEMKSRMRATAPLRSSSTNQRTVHHVRTDGDNDVRPSNKKCWLCKNSALWPDQCPKFVALSIDDLLKTAKENHVCLSCLKRAGRDHRAANCTRRQQCTKVENGTQCNQFHHALLHKSNASRIAMASSAEIHGALLPIVTANIHGQDGVQKRGNVLSDTGAQVSLIKNDTASTLWLKG